VLDGLLSGASKDPSKAASVMQLQVSRRRRVDPIPVTRVPQEAVVRPAGCDAIDDLVGHTGQVSSGAGLLEPAGVLTGWNGRALAPPSASARLTSLLDPDHYACGPAPSISTTFATRFSVVSRPFWRRVRPENLCQLWPTLAGHPPDGPRRRIPLA
jgi:hypothetical protein